MEEIKLKIGDSVRQIDKLNRESVEHWSMVQQLLSAHKLDEAISILNAYFRIKSKLQQVEASLQAILKANFSDK